MIGKQGIASKRASRRAGEPGSRGLGKVMKKRSYPCFAFDWPLAFSPVSGSPALRLALLVALAMALMLLPTSASTQTAATVLTLDQALSIAMDHNRDVQKAEEYRTWVKGKYIEERAGALPTFSLNGAGRRDVDKASLFAELFPTTTDTKYAEVTLTQTLFTWGQVGAAIKAAKVGIASADEQLRLYQQAARRDVTAAFYDVLLAKELADIADKNLAQKEAHLDEAQKKFSLGTATDYDALAAKVDVENARPATIRARNLVQVAKDQLRFLLGQDSGDVDAVGTLAAALALPPTYEEALATAFKRRPELAAQADRVEVYRQLVKIANAGNKPRLDLSGSYGQKWTDAGWADMGNGPTRLNPSGNYWSLGVFLKFPFFDGMRTKGQVMQARSDQTQGEIELAKLKDQVSLQARTAVDAVRENAEIVRGLAGTVEQAEKVLFMANKGFEYGVKTRLDVDDAQQGLNQARGNLARARRDYLVAQVSLLYVEGILGENEPESRGTGEPATN